MTYINMWVLEWNLNNLEVVQLVKDYTIDQVHQIYGDLIVHLKTSFVSCETFNSFVNDFYSHSQWKKDTTNKFTNALQSLAKKMASIRPEWRAEIGEALKSQFAYRLQDPDFSVLAQKLLITDSWEMNFTGFQAQCMPIFGTQSRSSQVPKITTNAVVNISHGVEYKTTSQIKRNKMKNKIERKNSHHSSTA